MNLRPYQAEGFEASLRSFEKNRSALVVWPTGMGKTILFAALAERFVSRGGRVMVLAHTDELIRQNADKIEAVTGIRPDIEKAELRSNEHTMFKNPYVVSSIQTQISGRGEHRRMNRFNPHDFSLLVIDEAHHCESSSYQKVIRYYKKNENLRILGVTATPDRLDKRALGNTFEDVAHKLQLVEAIKEGWLVRIRQSFAVVKSIDMSGVGSRYGDLSPTELEEALNFEEPLHGMIAPLIERSGDKRTLIFAVSVAHAERIAEIINREYKRGSAIAISAKTDMDERRALVAAYGRGDFQYLVNVGIATEGFDDPAEDKRGIQYIGMMRPTKSRALYAQCVGRGTRPLKGTVDGIATAEERCAIIAASAKPSITVLDFVGNAGHHKLVYASDILGGKIEEFPDLSPRLNQAAKESGGEFDVLVEADRMASQAEKEQEAKRRRGIKAKSVEYTIRDIDPFARYNIEPMRENPGWITGPPPTSKQMDALKRNKVPGIDRIRTRSQASAIIDAIFNGPVTSKQAFFLRGRGYDPSKFTRKTASAVIGSIKSGKDPARPGGVCAVPGHQ